MKHPPVLTLLLLVVGAGELCCSVHSFLPTYVCSTTFGISNICIAEKRKTVSTLSVSTGNEQTASDTEGSDMSPSLLIALRDKLLPSVHENGNAPTERSISLILASASPRRREILDMMGIGGKYKVQPSPLDESALQTELVQQQLTPKAYTQRLAEEKALALARVYAQTQQPPAEQESRTLGTTIFLLGSDTIVELDDKILEKPKDEQNARDMLSSLSGRQHHVHTGVALYKVENFDASTGGSPPVEVASFTETATVTFCNLTESDIDAYIKSGEPFDKAGELLLCFLSAFEFKIQSSDVSCVD